MRSKLVSKSEFLLTLRRKDHLLVTKNKQCINSWISIMCQLSSLSKQTIISLLPSHPRYNSEVRWNPWWKIPPILKQASLTEKKYLWTLYNSFFVVAWPYKLNFLPILYISSCYIMIHLSPDRTSSCQVWEITKAISMNFLLCEMFFWHLVKCLRRCMTVY